MKTEQTEIDTPIADASSGLFEDAPPARTAVAAEAIEIVTPPASDDAEVASGADDGEHTDGTNSILGVHDDVDDVPEPFGELSEKGKLALHTALLIAQQRDSDTRPGKSLVYNALDTFSAFSCTVLGAGDGFFQSKDDAVTTEEYRKLCSALELLIEVQSGIEEREKIAATRRLEVQAKSTLFEATSLWDNIPGDRKADTK